MRFRRAKRDSTPEELLRDCAKWRRRVIWGPIGGVASFAAIVIGIWLAAPQRGMALPTWCYACSSAMLASACLMLIASLRGRALARQVAELDDPKALVPLIDSLLIAARAAHPEVEAALTQQLSRITEEDAASLSEHRRNLLRHALSGRTSPLLDRAAGSAFGAAVMHALLMARDTQAIPHIEALCRKTDDPAVRGAASDALAQLSVIRDAATAQATLLRPADGAAEELLRPAASATGSEQLLRASVARGSETDDA